MPPELRLLRLLSSFFGEHPHPTTADWHALASAYPEQQSQIAEFAFSYAALGRIDPTELPAEWLG